jgi:hypothetical protein
MRELLKLPDHVQLALPPVTVPAVLVPPPQLMVVVKP